MYGELSSVVVCSTFLSQVNERPDQYYMKKKKILKNVISIFMLLFFLNRMFNLLIWFDAFNIIYVQLTNFKIKLIYPVRETIFQMCFYGFYL